MRKKLLLFATLLFSIGSYAQTEYSVSTSVEKKKALLEEYTGQGCYWCREGHAVASQMISKHGNKTYAVSIHTGGYAGSYYGIDFRTEEGDAIGNYFDCDKHGFPSGMVNRHDFIGDGTYIYSRSLWIDYAEQQINTDAPVNLYQKAVYDGNTNTLSIRVEGYFTAEQQAADQRLSVMITQDHIIAYQNGGGGDYEHNHVLRAMLTPAFGDVLESPAKGKFFAREYTYILPEKIGNVNVLPEDLTIISFVTNGQEEIQNVEGCKPEYVNYGLTPKAELLAPTFDIGTKWGYNFFDVKLRNSALSRGHRNSLFFCILPVKGVNFLLDIRHHAIIDFPDLLFILGFFRDVSAELFLLPASPVFDAACHDPHFLSKFSLPPQVRC